MYRTVLPLRERAAIQETWLVARLDAIVPELMRRADFDMWVVMGRENNEDPVLLTMLPPTMFHASWFRTILVFLRQADGSVKRLTLTRGSHASDLFHLYENVWNSKVEDEWTCLARLVAERDPQSIAINASTRYALADGLSSTDRHQLEGALGPTYAARLQPGERLAVGWLERRLDEELRAYEGIVSLAHQLIAEAFSPRVIHPGLTTTDDVVWWFREAVLDLRLTTWFQPSVSLQRSGIDGALSGETVIQPGDLLNCDFGIHYLGLATDTKHQAYVLQLGESEVPRDFQSVFQAGLRLQNLHLAEFIPGRTGNEVLHHSLAAAHREGIEGAIIYTHPLGFHGHAAGPIIGLAGQQEVPSGLGDYELFEDTCYSLGVEVTGNVPSWGGQQVRLMMEEDVVVSGGKSRYLSQRQHQIHIID